MTMLATNVNQPSSRKSSLSNGRARLVELMQQLCFGRIENLTVRRGEPIFDPPPKVSREVKLGSDNDPQELSNDDFLLKSSLQ